jgi:hypothetical protein
LSGDANESLPAAASVLGPSLLLQRLLASRQEFVVPQALRCGGCSYPREWNRSSVCNGTLSAGVCSLRLSGPEHLGILGVIPCFFPHRALGLACRLAEPLNQCVSCLVRKVTSEVSVSRRRRSPSARSAFAARDFSCLVKETLGCSMMSRGRRQRYQHGQRQSWLEKKTSSALELGTEST